MFDLQKLVDHITGGGNFDVGLARETNPDLSNIKAIKQKPKILLGFLETILTDNAEFSGATESYRQYANDISLVISVQIITTPEDFYIHWNSLYRVLAGWSPYGEAEKEFSGLTYKKGDMLGLSNNRTYWLDQWEINFPAVTLNQ